MASMTQRNSDSPLPLLALSVIMVLVFAILLVPGTTAAQDSEEEPTETESPEEAVPEEETTDSEDPDDILIIANNSVKTADISVDEIQDLFFKRRLTWSSGDRAVPINAPNGTDLRKVFQERLLKMNETEEQRFWQGAKIKSGLTPPVEFSNTLKEIYKLKRSISYVYRSQYKEGVAKILLVVPAS